jgi:murein L,D-transpeptidase YcbB/YkuD
MKLRYNSRFQGLVRALKILTNYESAEKQAEEYLRINGDAIQEHPELLAQIDYNQRQNALDEQNRETVKALEEQKKQQKNSPSFQDVLSKKIDTYTNQPYTIHEGQKGDSVKKIQQMLDKLDLGIVLKGYEERRNGSDSIFGNNTFDAVLLFQSNNGLSETGIVDSKTLSKMMKLYKEKTKNEK